MLLEIACFNFESALIADKAGAHRVELCENYKEGGITPSEQLIKKIKKELSVPVFIMIRPRPGDFIYSNEEFSQMKNSVLFCKAQKCDGLVFGILNKEAKIDVKRCKELVELANPLPCTFHRAFDQVENKETALEELIQCGFKRVLTSGNSKTAIEGLGTLKKLSLLSENRIIILPGGGIRSSNVKEFTPFFIEVHSAAITDGGETASGEEIKKIRSGI